MAFLASNDHFFKVAIGKARYFINVHGAQKCLFIVQLLTSCLINNEFQ
jgi:hypothetical protein